MKNILFRILFFCFCLSIFTNCAIRNVGQAPNKNSTSQTPIKFSPQTISQKEKLVNEKTDITQNFNEEQTEMQDYAYEESQILLFKTTNSFYVKNKVKLSEKTNFIIIDSQKKLDEFFGKSTMAKSSDTVNFNDSFVVAIIQKSNKDTNKININAVYSNDGNVSIVYELSQNTNKIQKAYFENPYIFAIIQKPKFITNIIFKNKTENKKTTISYGRRTKYSPKNIDDFNKNYTGIYKGTIPIENGSNMNIKLSLHSNHTFVFQQSYQGVNNRVFEFFGTWTISQDLSYFTLKFDKNVLKPVSYYFIDKHTIEQLDNNSDSQKYKLKK